MSIFFSSSYPYSKVNISSLSTFATPSYSLPQQEIIPIGKNVYLHSLYQEFGLPLPQHTELNGDFIIYKTSHGIVICIHDPTMPVEQKRIYQYDFVEDSRLVKHKSIQYITDKVIIKKLDSYNDKGRHPIVAHGKCELDMKTQYNLYGYKFVHNSPNKPIVGNIFKMVFITSKSNQHFSEYDITNAIIR